MSFYVIGEDALTCALGDRILLHLTGEKPIIKPINTKGVTKLIANLPRYAGLVRSAPVLCIGDTDGKCPVALRKVWFPNGNPDGFFLRLAVAEAESWALADRIEFSRFFGVPEARIPSEPDVVLDPKRQILTLAAKSSQRFIRNEVVSSQDKSKPGDGYNLHLCNFVSTKWVPINAAANSPSLARAMKRVGDYLL